MSALMTHSPCMRIPKGVTAIIMHIGADPKLCSGTGEEISQRVGQLRHARSARQMPRHQAKIALHRLGLVLCSMAPLETGLLAAGAGGACCCFGTIAAFFLYRTNDDDYRSVAMADAADDEDDESIDGEDEDGVDEFLEVDSELDARQAAAQAAAEHGREALLFATDGGGDAVNTPSTPVPREPSMALSATSASWVDEMNAEVRTPRMPSTNACLAAHCVLRFFSFL